MYIDLESIWILMYEWKWLNIESLSLYIWMSWANTQKQNVSPSDSIIIIAYTSLLAFGYYYILLLEKKT